MSGHGTFMRMALAIGDLGSPFYQEERQRDVWNEASAVGFQAMLWLGAIVATVMIWVGRETAVPYALGLMAIVAAGSFITVRYAHGSGVNSVSPGRMLRVATILYLALLGAFAAGLLVSVDWYAGGFQGGAAVGAAVGCALGVVLVGGLAAWRRFRQSGNADAAISRAPVGRVSSRIAAAAVCVNLL